MGGVSPPRAGRADPWPAGLRIPAPLRLHQATVLTEWADYNGHMSESIYLLVFGDNADAFFRFLGLDESYRAAGHSLYTAETHLRHLREATVGEKLALSLQVLGVGSKSLHIVHEMRASGSGCAATAEQMLLHVDTAARQVEPFPAEIAGRLRQIAVAHAVLGVPGYVGQVMRIRGQ
jgi:acyl-CoA thioester hydrolase